MKKVQAQIEGWTLAIAGVIYGGFVALLVLHDRLGPAVTIVALALIATWHGSLQHEVLHGHPFRSQRANDALGSLPVSLRLPYPVYRRTHLEHHRSMLTDPADDIESYYVSGDQWAAMSRARRTVLVAHQTLLGRMVLGPLLATLDLWCSQLREIRNGDRGLASCWAIHIGAVGGLLWLVVGVAGMPLWMYLVGAYAGHSLTLVRSYCEHRWVADDASRTAMVRAGGFFSLLYLNNNLHHAHHARPTAAWYRLPSLADQLGSDAAAAAGAGLYGGYGEVVRRYFLTPFDHPLHPLDRPAHMLAE